MVHIWHEDSTESSTSTMWKFLVKEKFNKKVQFEIFGTNGNGKLVQKVMSNKYTDEDIYIIFIDVPFNNEKTLGIYRDLMELTEDIKNVYVAKIICFEDLILKFKLLREWTRPTNEEAAIRYDSIYSIVEEFNKNGWQNSIELREYIKKKYEMSLDKVSSEKVAALLLTDLTRMSKAMFRVSKTQLGDCWTSSCCNFINLSHFCSLSKDMLSSKEKAEYIYKMTSIKHILDNALKFFREMGIEEIRDS